MIRDSVYIDCPTKSISPMPDVIERFSSIEIAELAMELGGILFTPSVFVNCLISTESIASIHSQVVLSILGRSTDFMLKGYMIETDKNIVVDNLRNADLGGYITPERFGIIQGALDNLSTIKCCPNIEIEANLRTRNMPLYDARRVETALQHGLTLLSSEPECFTLDVDELSHIFKHEYSDVVVGKAVSLEALDEDEIDAKIWIFKPEALATLLNRSRYDVRMENADRSEVLSLINCDIRSGMLESSASVILEFRGDQLSGHADQEGPIDATLRAVENALSSLIDLSDCDVHHRDSDTTTIRDSVRVRIRLSISERLCSRLRHTTKCFVATDESQNMLVSTARAYVKVLNTLMRELDY